MDDERAVEFAGLRQLAFRLLSPFGYDGSPERQPDLLVGRLPSDFPVELPMPEDARIVGSVIGERRTDIFFDTLESVESLQNLYYQRMADLGWLPMNGPAQTQAPRAGGFVHYRENRQSLYEIFGKDESGPSLSVNTQLPREGTIQVHVTLQTYKRSHESPLWHRKHNIFELLPPLHAPEGDTQWPGGGSGGHDEVWNNARLTTNLNMKEVGDHYQAQLVEAGWVLVEAGWPDNSDSGMRNGSAWSYWRFTDDKGRPWQGTFTALCHPDTPRDYLLMIQARLANDSVSESTMYSNSLTLLGVQRHDIV